VTASGAGLDPHITLAQREIDLSDRRVVAERAEKTKHDPAEVRTKIEEILRKHSFTPLSG